MTTGPAAGCNAELGWGLSATMRAFGQWASASVADLPGGPRGHLVLATIAQGRPPSQLALANALGVDRTVMTYLLDELETAGLVERRPDPADRRARQILITQRGSSALREYSARLREVEDRLLAPLDEREATAFRSMIERVARAAQTSPDAGCPIDDIASGAGPC
ncbi:MarR family winged helix-turn-helix transcriptional regulator [uncultured Jatrophihabitans sp.]|uniref:MarR family winged helix-turn-helix transcriptional regulator n=1 Tax=uncultured Jatrophihabitans sp. TaxID=1610747 RepID=UPI0035C9D150